MAKAKKKDKRAKKDKAEGGVAMTLLARLPPLEDVHRDAYTSQFTEAECAKLGASTRSSAVRDCGLSWSADAIGALLDSATASKIHYGAPRLAWLLELVVRLEGERAKSKSGEQQAMRTTRDLAALRARELRLELLEKLEQALAGRDEDLRHLIAARANESLNESLAALSALVGDLVSRTSRDPALRVLLETAHVSSQDASNASQAAESVASARTEVVLGGRAQGDLDAPAVNLVEGRVVKELRVLRDAFASARNRGVPTPPLVPTPAMSRVLRMGSPKKKKADQPAPPTA